MEKNTNDAYFAVYLPLLREGIAPPLPVVGGSMGPYLASERDAVILTPMEGIHPRVGDICLYRRDNGAYILHRIVGRRGDTYTFAGDAQTEREYGIRCDQLLGCVTAVVRKEKNERAASGGIFSARCGSRCCRGGENWSPYTENAPAADVPRRRIPRMRWTDNRVVC